MPAPIDDIVHGVPPVVISNTTTLVNRTGSWKYIRPIYRDRVAPCNEGCPVGIDIEGYMNLLREDRVEEACDLLLRENPMPAVTGRVCYHPCESACNRRSFDEPVSIHAVERMLGDRVLDRPVEAIPHVQKETVAVVGSGPAGLGCAYHLVRLGYAVTVLEAASEPGGILRLGIPDYRLPKDVLAREIDRIRNLGVEIRCDTRVGKDFPWEDLDSFDAVFVGPGAHRSRPLGVEGEEGPGVLSGLAFLHEVNFGARPDLGKNVVVVGGGNTAMDCARTALRLGAKALVLYRRTRAEMPAIDEEVREAEAEEVAFQFLAAPVGVRRENGKLLGLECTRMRLGEPDESGRRRPVPVPDSEFFVPADTVLCAVGESLDPDALPEGLGNGWGVETDAFGASTRPRFFAGGDVLDGPRTVAHALGAGKRAALGIDRLFREKRGETVREAIPESLRYGRLGNLSATRWREDDPIPRVGAANEVVPYEDLNIEHFDHAPMHGDRLRVPELRRTGFDEVSRGLGTETALEEARRCFNCGVCNQCELCLIFCPDVAISRNEDGHGFVIDYEHCKGCGLCNAECPRGAMTMTREGL